MKTAFSDSEIEIIKTSAIGTVKTIAFIIGVIFVVLLYIGIIWLIGHGLALINQHSIYTFKIVLFGVTGVLVLSYLFIGICVQVANAKYCDAMAEFYAKAGPEGKWNEENTESKTFMKLVLVFGVALLSLFFGMIVMTQNLPENMTMDSSVGCSFIAVILGGVFGTMLGVMR